MKLKQKARKRRPTNTNEFKENVLHVGQAHEKLLEEAQAEIQKFQNLFKAPDKKLKRQKRFLKKHNLEDLKPHHVPDLIKQLPLAVNRKELERAMQLLETHEAFQKPKRTQHDIITSSCKKSLSEICEYESWDTATTVIRHIKQAVCDHDWDSLTSLLILLLDHHSCYLPFVKDMCFLNFLMNKSDYNSEVLDAYVQQTFTKITKELGDFDIGFIDDMN